MLGSCSGSDDAHVTFGVVGVVALLLWSSGDRGSEEQLDSLARFLLMPGAPARLLFKALFMPLIFLLSLLNVTSWLTGLISSCLCSFWVCCFLFSFFSISLICLRYASSFLSSLLFLPRFSGLFSISESLSPYKTMIAKHKHPH